MTTNRITFLFKGTLLACGAFAGVASAFAKPAPLSAAHEKSRFAVIDPAYDPVNLNPAPEVKTNVAPWRYGEAELECWRLQVLRDQAQAAKLKVNYPGAFHTPSPRATFQLALDAGQVSPESFSLRAVGDVVVSLAGRELYRGFASESPHRIALPKALPAGGQTLQVTLSTRREPPALVIEDGPFATGVAPWRWSADGAGFAEPQTFPQTLSGVPPHRMEQGEVALKPTTREGELFDMGREVFGRISFACSGQPSLFVGESPAEAKNSNPRHFEQSTALKANGDGTWTSEHPLAFRYFRITGGAPAGPTDGVRPI